jgi:very-short-patch-repair endonuclease
MEVSAALERLGGVATTAQLVTLSSRRRLRVALRRGEITRVGRGRYASAEATRDRTTAISLAGVTSHLSAARHWGWPVKWPPDRPWVTVRRKRHLDAETRAVVNVSYADLTPDEIVDGVTSPLRTVLDCARRLPFDEALAVADSALRAGAVTRAELVAAAARLRGRGATQARRVAAEASAKAANPFESVLRALVLEFASLTVSPQLPVTARGRTWHPDLVDASRRLVLEADSWEFHTSKEAHSRDCVRYTALVLAGWHVVRFTWEQVMLSPAYVRDVLGVLDSWPGSAAAAS